MRFWPGFVNKKEYNIAVSATNRGRAREVNDNYPTPDWLTEAMVPHLGQPRHILEPAAGEGAIVRVLQRAFPAAVIDFGDIITGQDFMTYPWRRDYYDLIMTNPPYSLAMRFVRRALDLVTPGGTVVMLCRLSFAGSQERADFMRDTGPSLYITPRRPCFVRGKSDNCEYAWFGFNGKPPTVVWLETEINRAPCQENA